MEMHDTALVAVPPNWAIIVLVLNLFVPGLGTIVAGCVAKGDPAINNIFVGLLQLVLTPFFLLGWFWALVLSIQIIGKSKPKPQPVV